VRLWDREELGGAEAMPPDPVWPALSLRARRSASPRFATSCPFSRSNNGELAPYYPPSDAADRRCERVLDLVPTDPKQSYDVRHVMAEIVDDGEFFEVRRDWAANVVCAFARIDGHAVGVVANQPMVLAGCLDIHASEKAAGFVRTCDAFNIPLVTLVDVPGFMPGTGQEHGGIIRHGAQASLRLLRRVGAADPDHHAQAFGGAYIVMDLEVHRADLSFAWPGNEIAVMGPRSRSQHRFPQRAQAERRSQWATG